MNCVGGELSMEKFSRNPSWWKRRTTLDLLTLISVIAVIAVIGLLIGLLVVILIYKKNICLSAECIHTASRVIEAMDSSVEPCDDFYRFACGSFLNNTNIHEYKVIVDEFSAVEDKLQEQIKVLVSEKPREGDPKLFKLANYLFKACIDRKTAALVGSKPFNTIVETLGGWPVLKEVGWNYNAFEWQETVKKFRKLGFSTDYIFSFSVVSDPKNSTRRIINLDQPDISLSREYLAKGLDHEIVRAYRSYMVDMALLLGARKAQADMEFKYSLELEIDLAKISLSSEERRNTASMYNPMTIDEVQKKYPYVSWLNYINALLPEGLKVDKNEVINVAVPKFFVALGPLLANAQKRPIANYMIWRIYEFSAFFLINEMRERQLQYYTVLTGQQEREFLWKECVGIISGSLPISVGALYVRKYLKESANKTIAMEMVNGIQKEFEKILLEVSWMDDQTRKSALNKLKKMATHIGYPDEIKDNSKLAEFYKNLEIDPSMYLDLVLKIKVFETNYSFNKLRLPVNKTEWITHALPAVVNAYYSPLENSIQIPAGILEGKFFSADRPRYMNYGAIGYVIGHEITQGFADQGIQFDLNGNLVDWWQENTKKLYLERAKCIIQQYGNYTDKTTGLKLNGISTQGENIADNGGIKASYLAYKKWAGKYGPEPRLPYLNYSPQQLFWISAAQTMCSKYRPEAMKMLITTGVHSPAEFRVLGPMRNMRDFSKDFHCPKGSPMNPVQKCEVW